MTKVVYNAHGNGLYLNNEALNLGKELSGDPEWCWGCSKDYFGDRHDIIRHDPTLVKVVEKLKANASSSLNCWPEIREITSNRYIITHDEVGCEILLTPDNIEWTIIEEETATND